MEQHSQIEIQVAGIWDSIPAANISYHFHHLEFRQLFHLFVPFKTEDFRKTVEVSKTAMH